MMDLFSVIFLSQMENGIIKKDSHHQDSCWWGVGSEKTILSFKALGRGVSSQEGVSILFTERISFLSFIKQIQGFHELLKNASNLSVLVVRVEADLCSHFPFPVHRGP
jgi:hypothetical protein